MEQVDITPALIRLRRRGYGIIRFIEIADTSRRDMTVVSGGRYNTKREAVTALIDIAREMYALIQNCENADEAIPAIFGDWIP